MGFRRHSSFIRLIAKNNEKYFQEIVKKEKKNILIEVFRTSEDFSSQLNSHDVLLSFTKVQRTVLTENSSNATYRI